MTQLERVHVTLLAGLVVEVGGRTVSGAAWPTRRSAELVALLALCERHRLVRDRVVDTLWPHLDPDAGAANLRKAAHHARQALGSEDAVRLSGGLVALFPSGAVATDVAEFERRAEAAITSGDRSACAAVDDPGELLPEWQYEEWTQVRRDRLRALHVELLRLGGRWERLLEVEPADEVAHRELMRAALHRGDRHAAIRWYGRLRTTLEHDFGLPPCPQSRQLYEECVAGLGSVTSTVVGRQAELARVAAVLQAAEQGELGALVVRGPAGIGKTTLCREVGAAARERGWLVLTVVATAARDAYAPVAAAVVELLHRDRSLLDALPDATRSTLAELTALAAPAPPSNSGVTRHMVIGAVHRLIAACRTFAGVALVVDDAHLADDATVDLWGQLARTGGGVPFLGVAAFRGEVAPPSLTRTVVGLQRAGRSVEIDLDPLGPDEVATLVTGADPPPDAAVLDRIVTLAQGNPFFALELRRGVDATADATVAPSVWEAITERFLDLDDATAAVLRRLAVAADDLDPLDVPALSGLTEPEAFALLDAALDAGALVVSGTCYRFRHDLVRQALVAQVPPHHRISIHRDTARRLAAAGPGPA